MCVCVRFVCATVRVQYHMKSASGWRGEERIGEATQPQAHQALHKAPSTQLKQVRTTQIPHPAYFIPRFIPSPPYPPRPDQKCRGAENRGSALQEQSSSAAVGHGLLGIQTTPSPFPPFLFP